MPLDIASISAFDTQNVSVAPALAASTVAMQNVSGRACAVLIAGGTITVIAVNGVTVAVATGVEVVVPSQGTLTLTYSVAPTTFSWLPL